MPDIPPEVSGFPIPSAAEVGSALAALIVGLATALGLRNGARDRTETPISPSPESTGVVAALETFGFQQKIADDTERGADANEALLELMRKFFAERENEKRQSRDHIVDERLDRAEQRGKRLESNQARILELLEALDGKEGAKRRVSHSSGLDAG